MTIFAECTVMIMIKLTAITPTCKMPVAIINTYLKILRFED